MPVLLTNIASYIPEGRENNLKRVFQLGTDEEFLREKVGTCQVSRRAAGEETSDLCVRAFAKLEAASGLRRDLVNVLVVVTQNPDGNGIPHTSAIVHGKVGLSEGCAAFDLSLGCSGFVYGLNVLHSFMSAQQFDYGVIITCDPYSKIIDPGDKNTTLLFGDAATATLLRSSGSTAKGWRIGPSLFGTSGARGRALHNDEAKLAMDGRAVFNFSATVVPEQLKALLERSAVTIDEIDFFIFHQGSKFIVDTLRKRMGLPTEKVVLSLADVGNTVSSSIPLALEKYLDQVEARRIVLSGFGVGLSWASCLLERSDN